MSNQFKIIAKHWPSGLLLDGGLDEQTSTIPASFTRTAPSLAPGPGAPNGYQFLFWNTGRHVTNKTRVTWSLGHLPSGSTWTATAWYGGPGGGGTGHLIKTSAFALEDDAPLPGTPIDPPPASSFTNGPNGEKAYDPAVDNQVASTQYGPASVAALDTFPQQIIFKDHPFVGWLQLVLGGDTVGEFLETDDPNGGPVISSTLLPSPVVIGQGVGAELMAVYRSVPVQFPIVREYYPKWPTFVEWLLDYDRMLNPDPRILNGDVERIRAMADVVLVTRLGNAPDVVKSLDEQIKSISPEELDRAITSVKAGLKRAEAAAGSVEAALADRRTNGHL